MLSENPVILIPPKEGKSWNIGGVLQCKVGSDLTQGSYTVLELALPPQSGSPLHVHHREDEIFYIVEGECRIGFKDQECKATASLTVVLPKRTPHFFRNDGAATSTILITAVPGGLDRYFDEVSQAIESGQLEELPSINQKYEIEFFQGAND